MIQKFSRKNRVDLECRHVFSGVKAEIIRKICFQNWLRRRLLKCSLEWNVELYLVKYLIENVAKCCKIIEIYHEVSRAVAVCDAVYPAPLLRRKNKKVTIKHQFQFYSFTTKYRTSNPATIFSLFLGLTLSKLFRDDFFHHITQIFWNRCIFIK